MMTAAGIVLLVGGLIQILLTGFAPMTLVLLLPAVLLTGAGAWTQLRHRSLPRMAAAGAVAAALILTAGLAAVSGTLGTYETAQKIGQSVKLLNSGRAADAERILQRLYEKDPSNGPVNLNLAVVYLKAQKPELVRQHLDAARPTMENSDAWWYDYGLLNAQLEDPRNAQACFVKAVELNPDNVLAYIHAGTASYDLRELRRSLYYLEAAAFLQPDSPDIQLLLGRSHLDLMNLDEAEESLNRALALSPSASVADSADEMLGTVQAYRKEVTP